MTKYPICFKMWLNKKEWIEIFVWRTTKDMNEITQTKTIALSITYLKEKLKLGELHFIKKYWTWQAVMHELLHTSFGLYNRWGLEGARVRKITEEILCQLFQNIVKKWCGAIYKAGFRV